MKVGENVSLAQSTTLGVGGAARYVIEVFSEEDVAQAILFAREKSLPIFTLGKGSNVLVSDAGVAGVVLKMSLSEISTEESSSAVLLILDAGVPWEAAVDAASALGVFGITNLAGIPGSVGGAAVQNIGAYGSEFSEVFEYADVMHRVTGEKRRIGKDLAHFSYRNSFFKEHPEYILLRVALGLSRETKSNISYADILRAKEQGAALGTPDEITAVVREIRANKFPRNPGEGTAGSFFKNPSISPEKAAELEERFPGIPAFPQENGSVKISLAWVLDHVLSLKGYEKGFVRLYEKQPIVLVASVGATASEIDLFANEIINRVREVIGVMIEREVENFGA